MANVINSCGCDPATQTDPCGCGCWLTFPNLLIDSSSSPYADLTEATAKMAAKVASCLVESRIETGASNIGSRTYTASTPSNVLTVAESVVALAGLNLNFGDRIGCKVYLTAAGGVEGTYTFAWTGPGTPGTVLIALYEEDGVTLVDSAAASLPSAGSYSFTVPADGYYILVATGNIAFALSGSDETYTQNFTVDGGADAVFCGQQAAYGGTPDYLICT